MEFTYFSQLDAMDCGPACLRMIGKHYGKLFSLKALREKCNITRDGVSMLGISDAAESLGFRTLGVRLSFEQMEERMVMPCIAHWKQSHFVVVYKIATDRSWPLSLIARGEKKVFVADPAKGLVRYTIEEFKNGWISTRTDGDGRGHCLALEPSPDFYKQPEDVQSDGSLLKLLGYIKPYKKLVTQLVLSFVVASLLQLMLPFLTQAIVDRGVNYKDLSFLSLVLIAQLTLTLGQVGVEMIRGWILLHLTTRLNIALISDFLIRLMRLPIAFFESKKTGDLLQRIDDNNRIQEFLTSSSVNVIFSAANFLVFSIIIMMYNTVLFLIFIGGSALYVGWVLMFLKYRRELDARRFAQMSSNQSTIIQLITGMQEIKLNNCERQKRWEWEHLQAMIFRTTLKGMQIGQYQQGGGILINSVKNFVITFIAAKAVIDGQMTLGMMLSVQFIIGQLNGPVEQFINFTRTWQDAKLSFERLTEIKDSDAEDGDDQMKVNEWNGVHDLHLKNVTFSYDHTTYSPILKNISITIPARKITAIVGTSGSGKTTLLKLLLGFYRPTSGEILLGNTRLHQINCHLWRKHTGAVMQDGFIFSDTIANNIAVSEETVDKAKLLHAVRVANVHDFIDSLPIGYNTKIGNDGHGISQGQRQRILIARSIYKDPDYIFFDEATNALDANNELVIMNNLNHFLMGKTVVVVAHRLSTVRNADNIVVLDKGEIIEQGTHEELSIRKGAYYHLVKNQLELGT
jgi:ATP-binding cassette subfamily B protein